MESFRERYIIPTCTLDKDSLLELEKVIRGGFPDDHLFEYEVEFDNIFLKGSSIEGLITHEKIPSKLHNLDILCWHQVPSSKYDLETNVSLNINPVYSTATVEGYEEIWTTGKFNQIVKFFNAHKKNKNQFLITFLSSLYAKSIILGTSLVGFFYAINNLSLPNSLLFSIPSVFLLIRYLDWSSRAYQTKVMILLKKSNFQILGMSPKEYIPIVISLIALIISLIKK